MRNMKVTTSSARIVTNAGAALIGSVLRNKGDAKSPSRVIYIP